MKHNYFLLIVLLLCSLPVIRAQVRYADQLINYTPAPGQHINKAGYGLSANAQSTVGGLGFVSLGFWGGQIIYGFDTPVKNHPDNPYGVDFTIFGNPFLGSSEPAIVQVMKDENNNGKADDTWYELRGSDHYFSGTKHNYSITYTNPHGKKNVPWIDSDGKHGEVMHMAYHGQEHYPMAANFPHINQDEYGFTGTRLKSKTAHGTYWVNYEFDYGYADNKKVQSNASHDVPDNPYTLDVTEGCGGDAFDISWAIDRNGQSVTLDQIDFIKIYTGVTQNAGAIGEVSTDIRGVAVVKPDASVSGLSDVIISTHPLNTGKHPVERKFKWYKDHTFSFESYVISKGFKNGNQQLSWTSSNSSIATITADGKMRGVSTGEVTVTCTWLKNTAIKRSFTIVITDEVPTAVSSNTMDALKIYPNPVVHSFKIAKANHADVTIYNVAGKKVMQLFNYNNSQTIETSHLPRGLYILQVKQHHETKILKFIKR